MAIRGFMRHHSLRPNDPAQLPAGHVGFSWVTAPSAPPVRSSAGFGLTPHPRLVVACISLSHFDRPIVARRDPPVKKIGGMVRAGADFAVELPRRTLTQPSK